MKTLSIVTLVVAAILSSSAFAEGSKIEGSTITNASSNTGNLGLAIGKDSTVNTGSIDIK